MSNRCVFCKENRFLLNQKAGLDVQQAVIYENERICITPDLAPLTSGHLLILSQDHFNSYADAPVCVINDLLYVIRYLSDTIFPIPKLHGLNMEPFFPILQAHL